MEFLSPDASPGPGFLGLEMGLIFGDVLGLNLTFFSHFEP